MLKIAFILPSLANRGPILVARDLSAELDKLGHLCTVFYFDEHEAIDFAVPTQQITYRDRFDFQDFDVVHSHGLRPDRFVYKNRRAIKAVCLSTMHNIIIEEYKTVHNYAYAWLIQQLWIQSLKRHDALVCLNREMKSYYRRFFSKKPITVVYNGRSIAEGPENIPSEDLEKIIQFKEQYTILGSACLVTKRKGLQQVINALPSLTGYGFMLIGDGPELEQLKVQARQLNIAGRCLFLGTRPQAERYYPYFDFFVMASYAEGMPLSLLEAAAIGLPTLCSDIPVLREILSEQETCFFKLEDTADLVNAAERLRIGRETYAKNIKALYDAKFTSGAMALNYQAVYNELTTNKQLI